MLNRPTESKGTRLGGWRGVEWSGGAAFAVGPCDVVRWLPVGREVREEVNEIKTRVNRHVRTTCTGDRVT